VGATGHFGSFRRTAGDKALLIRGLNMGIVVNSKKRELTGPEIASYIAEMLPEMSRMARDHNMASLAESLDRALGEALRYQDIRGGNNVIRLP